MRITRCRHLMAARNRRNTMCARAVGGAGHPEGGSQPGLLSTRPEYFIRSRGQSGIPGPIGPEPRRLTLPISTSSSRAPHGPPCGEDGTVSGAPRNSTTAPTSGAGVSPSAVAMDKAMMKRVSWAGKHVANCRTFVTGQPASIVTSPRSTAPPPFPHVVKGPANLGSSVGISKAHETLAELETPFALRRLSTIGKICPSERGITGPRTRVAVLRQTNRALRPPSCGNLGPFPRAFYDDEGQVPARTKAGTKFPADLTPEARLDEIRHIAIECLSAAAVRMHGGRGVGFRLEAATGKLYIQKRDQNTIPGSLSISRYSKNVGAQRASAFPTLFGPGDSTGPSPVHKARGAPLALRDSWRLSGPAALQRGNAGATTAIGEAQLTTKNQRKSTVRLRLQQGGMPRPNQNRKTT